MQKDDSPVRLGTYRGVCSVLAAVSCYNSGQSIQAIAEHADRSSIRCPVVAENAERQ